jgi:MinD superfamily P-loop ATPase
MIISVAGGIGGTGKTPVAASLAFSSQRIKTVARIPFGNMVTEAMIHGVPVVEYNRNGLSHRIAALWETIVQTLK